MELHEYYDLYMENVKSIARENQTTKKHAFLTISLDKIVDFGDLENYQLIESEIQESNFPNETSALSKADGWDYNENFQSLTLKYEATVSL